MPPLKNHLQNVMSLLTLSVLTFATGSTVVSASVQAATADEGVDLLLHVPSPDWRDQIIYFVMIDRFQDGDTANNEQGRGVYKPKLESHYSGGDLAGISQRLDYVQALGATTLWLTPPVANQWWDPKVNYGGYHGYWARDFANVDEHYGTLESYQVLSSNLHRRGMYLMQDIVVNHVGNFFGYGLGYDPQKPQQNVWHNPGAIPTTKPTQYPFNLNDPGDDTDFAFGAYNWTPEITDMSDKLQELTYQTSGLDDMNTRNPVVVKTLKDSYAKWIREVGVDAFRIDTAKYVEPEFYDDFFNAPDGIDAAAKATGRDDFFSIGEIYLTSDPMQNVAEMAMLPYLNSATQSRIDAPLGFPLYKEIERVFAKGRPTRYLSYRLQQQMDLFPAPLLTANFIDNHDVERFLMRGDVDSFQLAYTFMLMAPGIPVIYQGDEQLFTTRRQAMFAGGYQSQRDHFDQQSAMFKHVQALSKVRHEQATIRRGDLAVVADSASGAGVFAFSRSYEGEIAYIILNTAAHPVLLNQLATRFAKPLEVETVFQQGYRDAVELDESGIINQVLPSKSALVLIGKQGALKSASTRALKIDDLRSVYVNQSKATISGAVETPGTRLLRIIDGNYAEALEFVADDKGQWSVDLPVDTLGESVKTVTLYAPDWQRASPTYEYRISNDRADFVARVEDAAGDDTGPQGSYKKLQHASFGCQMDIRDVHAQARASTLLVTVSLCDVTAKWSPPNGFDHLSLNVYFNVPALQGQTAQVLPKVQAEYPGKGWHLAHEVYGWNNVMFSADGASAEQVGNLFAYSPMVTADLEQNTIEIRYDGSKLGVESWEGATLYMTTWDRDGGDGRYRPLSPSGGLWTVGGGKANDPYVMDDIQLTLGDSQH